MEKNSWQEIKVGAFILSSIVVVAVLIISFGRLGSAFQSHYNVTVEFQDASGIIKDAQVLYRGARVGKIKTAPAIADGGNLVTVRLAIRNDVRIPKSVVDESGQEVKPGAHFQVSSYGLLGDRFIDVVPPKEETGVYLQDGDTVKGNKESGLSDLAEQIKPIVDKFDDITQKIDSDAFAADLQESVKQAREILQRVNRLTAEAEKGDGALAALLNDPETAGDLRDAVKEFKMLAYNLRKKGVLFYSDLAGKEKETKSK